MPPPMAVFSSPGNILLDVTLVILYVLLVPLLGSLVTRYEAVITRKKVIRILGKPLPYV